MSTVVLLGALDTKEDEYAFLRDRVTEAGCDVVMINAGVLGDPGYPIEVDRRTVASEVGANIDSLAASGDRGAAVANHGRRCCGHRAPPVRRGPDSRHSRHGRIRGFFDHQFRNAQAADRIPQAPRFDDGEPATSAPSSAPPTSP